MKKLDNNYTPSEFENDIYKFWLEKNFFHGIISSTKKPFSIVIPPPNITGYLHIGHALNNTLQDILVRYARMKGFSTCWIPGTDHAGIATQNVVEKELNKKGITRYDLGRDKFIEKVWEWRQQYGSRIISQLKSLGCSCDWDRLRFTFDDDYVKAVNHEFVELYNDGLIYKGNYMINWCPRCVTAISDIEVEHKEKKGKLWDIKYPLIDGKTGKTSSTEFIVVSTTRPETMLGDTAVAVNPDDPRYKKFIGRQALLPLMDRIIPIIADSYVDMKFGTGAVKVTPSHDPNDFEIGKRHNLGQIDVMTDDGMMSDNAGAYEGLDRYKARKKIVDDLKKSGLLVNTREHISSQGACSRCETVIEPRISNQWFISMKKLAGPAIGAVKDGKIKFIPKKWEKLYFNWMENIRDWCISRQLWWGHRIPVWYCDDCNNMIAAEEQPLVCRCGSTKLRQDNDVLDTWVSSCLWPFASMGWPKETAELRYYFPTSVLVTAHDIIFFWVARMIMMSLYFMKEVPFKEVFINPLVNDIYGQKMSKSKGNVIYPLSIIEKSGTDILRFTLASLTTPGKNLLLGNEKIEGSRNFANKLWNASKFVITNLNNLKNVDFIDDSLINPEDTPEDLFDSIGKVKISHEDLNLWDRWIISKFTRTIKAVEKYLEKYNISFACRTLVNFFWNDYCDWYIETAKTRLYSPHKQNQYVSSRSAGTKPDNGMCSSSMYDRDKITAAYVLWYVLERYLKLLHPFMPFITEKIWQSLPHDGESIMVSEFPLINNKALDRVDNNSESSIGKIFEITGEIRKIRSELKINPSSRIKVCIVPDNSETGVLITNNEQYLVELVKIESLNIIEPADKKGYIKSVKGSTQIYIYLPDVIDADLEIKRINSEISKVNIEKDKSTRKISNPQFMEKAPDEVIQKEKAKLKQAMDSIKVLQEQLELMNKIRDL